MHHACSSIFWLRRISPESQRSVYPLLVHCLLKVHTDIFWIVANHVEDAGRTTYDLFLEIAIRKLSRAPRRD